MMGEWLRFVEIEKKSKTSVYGVYPKNSKEKVGVIKWYPQWRHYCFFPTLEFETVHSDRCLQEISECISELNTEHKGGKRASSHE